MLNSSLQRLVYEYVCRSLFKADRLMFALHMVHGMFPDLFKENVRGYYQLSYNTHTRLLLNSLGVTYNEKNSIVKYM